MLNTAPLDLDSIRQVYGGVIVIIEREGQAPYTALIDANGFEWGRTLSGLAAKVAHHGRHEVVNMLRRMKPGEARITCGKTYRIPGKG